MKRLLVSVVMILIATLAPSTSAQAQDGPQLDPAVDSAAGAVSTNIVRVVVASNNAVETAEGWHTVSEVQITETIAGSLADTILVATSGGELPDGSIVATSHAAVLDIGEAYELTLEPATATIAAALASEHELYSVVGGEQGVLSLNPLNAVFAQGANDYALNGISWDTLPLEYRINPQGSGLSQAVTVAAVRRAFDAWEDDPKSDVTFEYGGLTNQTGIDSSDRVTVVSWVNGPVNGWLGQTSSVYSPVTKTFFDADIRMNTNYRWADGAQSGAFDIEWTLTHEIGHAVGLDHVPSASQVMYFAITQGRVRALQSGDLGGIRALYPAAAAPTGGPYCDGRLVTVDMNTGIGAPTEGPDVILGTPGVDHIISLGGDDVICAGQSIDRIDAGAGNDLIFGEGGSDYIDGGTGDDTINGGSGADRINGGDGNDMIFGNGGQDFLWGDAGNDIMQGNWQSDYLYGGDGNDILRGAGGKDKLYGELGADQLYGGVNTDYLNGGAGQDSGDGQSGRDYPVIAGRSGCEGLEVVTNCG